MELAGDLIVEWGNNSEHGFGGMELAGDLIVEWGNNSEHGLRGIELAGDSYSGAY